MADYAVHPRAHDLLPGLKLNAAGKIFILAQKLGKTGIRQKEHDAADFTQPRGNCRPAEAEVKRTHQKACGKDERRERKDTPLLRLGLPCAQALCEQFGLCDEQDKAKDKGRDEEHTEQPPCTGIVKSPGWQEEEQSHCQRAAEELHDALSGKSFSHGGHLKLSQLYPFGGRSVMRKQHRSALWVAPQGL